MHARELLARFSTFCQKLCNTLPLRKLFVCLSPFFLSDNPGCININNTVMLNSGREVGVFSWISMRSGFVRVAVNKRRRRSNRIIRRILTRKPFLWCRVCSVFLVFFSLSLSFFLLSRIHDGTLYRNRLVFELEFSTSREKICTSVFTSEMLT